MVAPEDATACSILGSWGCEDPPDPPAFGSEEQATNKLSSTHPVSKIEIAFFIFLLLYWRKENMIYHSDFR